MAFYADFAGHYEKVFPYKPETFAFLDRWLPKKGRVLDVGCGTGRYCAALDRSGRRCQGIDLDPGMIDQAEKLHPEGRFQILGMEEIGLLSRSSFAGVMCIGNVLPHLPAAGLAGFLLNVKQLLIPGGIWIFQTVNFDPILRAQEPQFRFPVLKIPDGDLEFHRWYEDIGPERLTFCTQLTAAGEEVFAGEVELAPRPTLEYLLGHEAAGFELLGHFADYLQTEFQAGQAAGSVWVWRRVA